MTIADEVISGESTFQEQARASRIGAVTIPLAEAVLGPDSLYLNPRNDMSSRIIIKATTGNPQIEETENGESRFEPVHMHRETNFPKNPGDYFYIFTTIGRPGMKQFVGDYIEKRSRKNLSGREYTFPNGYTTFQQPMIPFDTTSLVPMFRLTAFMLHKKPGDIPPDGVLVSLSAMFL